MARLQHTGTIRPVAPFDFDQAIDFILTFPPMHGEQVVSEKSLTRAAWASTTPVAFKLSATGTVEDPELSYELHADDPLSEADVAGLVRRIGVYLSVHDDLFRFYELIDSDPPFAAVKEELYGYHQVKFLTPFENACWTILSQRNLLGVAQHMKRSLIEEFSAAVEFNGRKFWPFPGVRSVVQRVSRTSSDCCATAAVRSTSTARRSPSARWTKPFCVKAPTTRCPAGCAPSPASAPGRPRSS